MSTAYGSGELTERVTFYREVLASDGQGGRSSSLQSICTVWALVRPMSGKEIEHAHMIEASGNYFVVIRYRDDIRENDIAEWRGRKMNIRFVKDRGQRSQYLEMNVETGVAT